MLCFVGSEVFLPCSKDFATLRYLEPGEPTEHHVKMFR